MQIDDLMLDELDTPKEALGQQDFWMTTAQINGQHTFRDARKD